MLLFRKKRNGHFLLQAGLDKGGHCIVDVGLCREHMEFVLLCYHVLFCFLLFLRFVYSFFLKNSLWFFSIRADQRKGGVVLLIKERGESTRGLFLFVIMFYCIFLCISELFVVFSKKKC
jgi:hypothetical protein